MVLITLLQLGAALIILTIGIFFIYAARSLAPWVPSSAGMALRGLEKIPATSSMKLVDLGCGDGRIVFAANKKYGLEATGFEISLLPYLIAKCKSLFFPQRNVHIFFKNIFSVDISSFDIIYVYGLPKTLNRILKPKIEKEIKPGAYLVSYNFRLEEKVPITVLRDTIRTLYIYRF